MHIFARAFCANISSSKIVSALFFTLFPTLVVMVEVVIVVASVVVMVVVFMVVVVVKLLVVVALMVLVVVVEIMDQRDTRSEEIIYQDYWRYEPGRDQMNTIGEQWMKWIKGDDV